MLTFTGKSATPDTRRSLFPRLRFDDWSVSRSLPRFFCQLRVPPRQIRSSAPLPPLSNHHPSSPSLPQPRERQSLQFRCTTPHSLRASLIILPLSSRPSRPTAFVPRLLLLLTKVRSPLFAPSNRKHALLLLVGPFHSSTPIPLLSPSLPGQREKSYLIPSLTI